VTELLVRERVVAIEDAPPPPEGRARFLLRRPGLVVSAVYVALVVLAAFAPHLLAPADPAVGVPAERLQPPGPAHLFGTDYLGRDVYTRVVHGAALSLQATLIAVTVALVVGGLVGVLAGFVRGWLDEVLMRGVDVLLAVPAVLLSLALITALGYGAPPPAPEWGSLVAEGRNYMAVAWWLCAVPGAAIAATVLAVNRISRALDGAR
jgi:peptide/nickel transport system permease protein